jgi:hypothetical protein
MVSADELQAEITQLRKKKRQAQESGDRAAEMRIQESLTVKVAAFTVKTGRAPD